MLVHTFFIALAVFLMGLLCLIASAQLLQTPLGKLILWGLFIFWFIRLLVQFVGYSPQLWKGKPTETTIHILLSLLWVYLSTVFLLGALFN